MNVRARFTLIFCGICLLFVLLLYATILFLPRVPVLRWAILVEWLAYFAGAIGVFQYYLKRLPRSTQDQSKAARAARRAAWLFFAAPLTAFIARGQELTALPYFLGFVLPLLPIVFGIYYLRLSIRLSRAQAAGAVAQTPGFNS